MKYLSKKEEEQAIIQILEVLLDKSLPYSGAHRRKQWEKGWGENLESGNITPKYFGKYPVQRLNGRLVKGMDEKESLYSIVDKLAKKYLSKAEYVVEFGCGTGHNLLRVKKFNKNAEVFCGCDWVESSQKLVDKLGDNFVGVNFDFFHPGDINVKNCAVYTVAALEQVGTKFKPFVKYLLKNKPSVVVHIEPMPEYLDSTKLLDYLSIQYMYKRNYLRGYRDYIEELEKQGKVEILESRRSGIGSFLIDGYSILVWRPKK